MRIKIGVCFSKDLIGENPLDHIGRKLPVYLHFLSLCQKNGWEVYILTRKTYEGKGIFRGDWLFENNKFKILNRTVKINLVYDRTAGVSFPPAQDSRMTVVNRRDFKFLCWDKWLAYRELGHLMPKTFLVKEKNNLVSILSKIKTDWVVLKPRNGLKGLGVFIGPKKEALKFEFPEKFKNYIAQEFIDTAGGIPQIVEGLHDLRIVIINGKPVWSHVRVPPQGSFKANTACGGILKEVDYKLIPSSIKEIVARVAQKFYQYDNPVFSLDFGLNFQGKPSIFEINDHIGFPRWEMKARDLFLNQLILNFGEKIKKIKNNQNA